METVLLQLKSAGAYELIKDLEALNLVKILGKGSIPTGKLSEKLAGSLNLTEAEHLDLQNQLTQMRNEWERDI